MMMPVNTLRGSARRNNLQLSTNPFKNGYKCEITCDPEIWTTIGHINISAGLKKIETAALKTSLFS